MSGIERMKSTDRVKLDEIDLPPITPLFDPPHEPEKPVMALKGVYKAEAGDPKCDYCVYAVLVTGEAVELPERYLRQSISEALINGRADVLMHPKTGGNPSQGVVSLTTEQIFKTLNYLQTTAPANRPFGPSCERG